MTYGYRTSFTAAAQADREETIVDGRFSSSGDIALADGTATQGAIYFADDKNTGIYSPSNNQIAFTTDGSANVILGGSALVHIKAGSQHWSQGLLLEDSAGGDGWNFYPDPDSGGEFFIGYNDDVVGSPNTSTTVFKLKGSDKSATFAGDIITTADVQCKDIILTDEHPMITFTDNNENPDYRIKCNSGTFEIEDTTNDKPKLTISSSGTIQTQSGTTGGGNYNLALRNKNANNDYSLLFFQSTDSNESTSTAASIRSNFAANDSSTNGRFEIRTRNAGTLTTALTLDETQNATFTGNVDLNPNAVSTAGSPVLKITNGSAVSGGKNYSLRPNIPSVDNAGFTIYNESDTRNELSIDGSGNTTLGGELKLSLGKGIDFGSMADTGTGEVVSSSKLDDYEEGTWTPTVWVEGQSAATTDKQYGHYIKVGRKVTVWAYVQLDGTPSSRGTSKAWQHGGLPFESTDIASGADTAGSMLYWTIDSTAALAGTAPYTLVPRLSNNATTGRIRATDSSSSQSGINASLLIKDNTEYTYTITYLTD